MAMRGNLFAAGAVALAVLAVPARAQMAEPACVAVSDSNLPDDLAGWAKPPVPVSAAAGPGAGVPALTRGSAAAVTLQPAATVRFKAPPEQARAPENAHAGLVSVRIPASGIWRVSASKPVWIDVLGLSGAVKSTAHGALAPCTSIRKVVEFQLVPGDYLVQLSGNPGPDLKLMVSPKP